MTPFYDTEQRRAAVVFHAGELLGTPFAAHAMVPGVGIDCVHVNAWAYLKTRFLDQFNPPAYSLDAGSHNRKSQLLDWLERHPRFRVVNAGELMTGDTLCFNLNLSEHHAALCLGGKSFAHVLHFGARKVITSSLKEPYYAHRLRAVYRPMEGADVR